MFVFEEFLKNSIDDNLDEKAFADTSADSEKKSAQTYRVIVPGK